VLTPADVGHTIRVQESATNAGGTSGPVSSAATAIVTAPKPACVVPKVKGKRLARAKAAIRSHHCRVGKIRHAFSKRLQKGRVISQRPKPHKVLHNGAKVNLVVSRGRKR
jgi:beta-lactam-binding protein with PASTA domain